MAYAIDYNSIASADRWFANLNAPRLSPWMDKEASYPWATMRDFEKVLARGRPESYPRQQQATWPQMLFLKESLPKCTPLEWNASKVETAHLAANDNADYSGTFVDLVSGVVDETCTGAGSPLLGEVLKAFPLPPPAHPPQKRKTRKHKQKKGNLVPFSVVPSDEAPCKDGQQVAEQTVMIRHIACSYTQEQVMAFLDEAGFAGKYNFVYLPSNPAKNANLGYAFVNFISEEYVEKCKDKLDGRVFGTSCTQKKCRVALAHMQGYSMMSRQGQEAQP